MIITADILNKITPSIKGKHADDIAAALNIILPVYKMDVPTIFHEFWANVLEESWEMGKFVENLNYKTESIVKTWPTRFANVSLALPYAHNPQKLANKVYGGRMGNIQPNDGWDFRGSGPIQITGRDTITLFILYLNKLTGINRSVYETAQLLRTDISVGIHSACWFFTKVKNLIPLAISDRMIEIVRRINGGTTGLSQRLAYYDACKKWVL